MMEMLDDALAHWAQTTPEAPARSHLGQVTTSDMLNQSADAIAAHLMSQGVAKGDRVVVYAAKAPHTIAAVYGVLRAGAVYVPIDPGAPEGRIAQCLEQVTPAYILTDPPRMARASALTAAIPCADLTQTFPAADPVTPHERSPDDPAYILMTSGSTGTPKGILHTHKSGLAYARMTADLCALRANDRVSHHTPLHFDPSIFDIFSAARAGAFTVIIPEMYTKIPASLAQLTQDEAITVWYSVPYALIQLSERGALDTRDFSALRIVMFAGEKMPPAALKSFAAHTPNATFLNAYGPTETNHCVTARLTHADLDGISPIPIGFPDAGVTAQISDSGELLIASDQVMQGYWNDPPRTAAAFVDTPDETGQTRRFYRTGDIVQRLASGALLLIGREDRQIKLRGYRIELDEIERALTNAPGVTEAAVLLHDEALHAFITGPAIEALEPIRAAIATTLPPYALPEHITALRSLARTSTGKIDRNALLGRLKDQNAA